MKFNHSKFAQAIVSKKFELMKDKQEVLSLRKLSKLTGSSPSGLSRIMNGRKAEIDSILKICTWLKQPITNFIDK